MPRPMEFSYFMTMVSCDHACASTRHEGLWRGHGRRDAEIEGIGRMSLAVADPLKRRWERGVYMGADSTRPDAVKRHRPRDAG